MRVASDARFQTNGHSPAAEHADADLYCEELLVLTRNLNGLDAVGRACDALCGRLGFGHYHLNLCVPVSVGQPASVTLSSLPANWQKHYRDCDYRALDPVIERSTRSLIPFFWDDIEGQARGRKLFFSDAKRFGVGFGLTFPFAAPLNTTGLLSFVRSEPLPLKSFRRGQLAARAMWLAMQILEGTRILALKSCGLEASGAALLTRRERECLALSGDGYTTSQIAIALNIAPRTVAFHIDRSVVKLGVHSRRAALRRALLLGEIDLQFVPRSVDGRKPLGSGRAAAAAPAIDAARPLGEFQ
jgi:DNA-binding CsgD family transcriptional regulator